MNRRQFAKNIGMCGIVLGMGKATCFSAGNKQPEIAITLDDFNVYYTPTLSGAARNQAILDALARYNIKAGMFVNGKHVDNEKNMLLLRLWDKRGHNDSQSHLLTLGISRL